MWGLRKRPRRYVYYNDDGDRFFYTDRSWYIIHTHHADTTRRDCNQKRKMSCYYFERTAYAVYGIIYNISSV